MHSLPLSLVAVFLLNPPGLLRAEDAARPDLPRQASRYGPQRSDPAQGTPKHAYSPFDKLDSPPPYEPIPGRDYREGALVIRFAPEVAVQARAGVAPAGAQADGGLTDQGGLNRALAVHGITRLERVFPNVQPMVARLAGATTPEGPDLTRWYRARVAGTTKEAVETLSVEPGIAVAEPEYLRRLADGPIAAAEAGGDGGGRRGIQLMAAPPGASIPNSDSDPLIAQQGHLAAAGIPEAWAWLESQALPPGGSHDVVVAVIDTGVDYTHPDLAANLWTNSREIAGNGQDDDGNGYIDDVHGARVEGTRSGDPMDDHGHGTHVAGIIAAQGGNHEGGAGVAYGVQIMPIKAAQYSGVLTSSDVAEAIRYAVAQGADIINMSFGGYARSQIEEDALAVAFGQCVLVAAAGNDGFHNESCDVPRAPRPMYPAAYNWVLGVMARTQNPDARGNYLAGFSNFDGIPGSPVEYELMAPGVDVWSTLPGGQYAAWDGTSMAAPVVSGLAALARTRWSDKEVYSSRFIMGQIATTGESLQGRLTAKGDAVSYHTANARAALTTVPKPQLAHLQHWLFDTPLQDDGNDDDGLVDAGETLDLAVVIRNQWGKADPVSVTLEAWAPGATQADPYVEWITNTVDYGAIGSFNWDDNGLIYDADQTIIGVRNPFRFVVSADCPNNHVIPFRVTMAAWNGLDPGDPQVYITQSHFQLVVQRGRELPRIVSGDMTLTPEDFWLVPDQVLVEAGATLRVTEGTQIQFWSTDPSSPYSTSVRPLLQVEGRLVVQGSAAEPAELFNNPVYPEYGVLIQCAGRGVAELHHARVLNPLLGSFGGRLTQIDHCHFDQEAGWIRHRDGSGQARSYGPEISAHLISSSIFRRIGWGGLNLPLTNNLFDTCPLAYNYLRSAQGNVFLKNYRAGVASQSLNSGYFFSASNSVRAVAPEVWQGKTYFAVHGWTGFEAAEAFARHLGGHLAAINDAAENEFLRGYVDSLQSRAGGDYSGSPIIGLVRSGTDGPFSWTSGEPVTYTHWAGGFPSANRYANSPASVFYAMRCWASGVWEEVGFDPGGFLTCPCLLEVPGTLTQADLDAAREVFVSDGFARQAPHTPFRNNAILNVWWDPDPAHWLRFGIETTINLGFRGRDGQFQIGCNYWGTASALLIERSIWDYEDNFNLGRFLWQPALSEPPADCYPFVVDVALATAGGTNLTQVGAEPVTFTVTFNRDMDPAVPPQVSFGPDTPMTDYTVHPVDGGWHDSRTWVGTFAITPVTGDGYQLIRVAGAVAADDPWLVTGEDSGRFRFEIITSGTESMNLQATGGEGRVDLSWMQDDFELLAGYRLYRSAGNTNDFVRLNSTLIPAQVKTYQDGNVTPGEPYYYRFTVVKTDMTESDYSNVAQGTPLDTIPPVITHVPVTSATPGLPLTLFADATDNVAVQGVTLFFRGIGSGWYASRAMTRTGGNQFAATLEGSLVVSPGIEYYLEATDGVSVRRSGRPDLPWSVTVNDRPVVTVVTPNTGPDAGGTLLSIAGANFKAGARVRLGETPAEEVVVVSSSLIQCRTAAHYPAVVDVTVVDTSGQSGSLLRAFTYRSRTVSLGLPATGGGHLSVVEVPVNAANVSGLGAATLTVMFDGAVLRALGARTGSLTPGWAVAANTKTAGQVLVSTASPGGTSSGSGVLVLLEFEVLGAAGAATALQWAGVSLNDGAIPVETAAGSFAVSAAYDVSGRVVFWNGSRAVPGVQLDLAGARVYSGTSGSDGTYTVAGAEAGSYVLTPGKQDQATGITAYDASLVLQHDAQLTPLGGDAAVAGDADTSGQITALDAFYILQDAVGLIPLPFPGAGAVWKFLPANRSYANLNATVSGQNFRAVLLGDVSGNWPAGGLGAVGLDGASGVGAGLLGAGPGEDTVVLALKQQAGEADGTVRFWLLAKSAPARIYALDLVLEYEGSGVQPPEAGGLSEGMNLAANLGEDHRVRAALAGAVPVGGVGALLTATLASTPPVTMQIASAMVNEGLVPVVIDATAAVFDADNDGDGLSDWEEILAGTNPTDHGSVLALTQVTMDAQGRRVLRWASVAGKTYQPQSCVDLAEGEWKNVAAPVKAEASMTSVTDEISGSGRAMFYRLQLIE